MKVLVTGATGFIGIHVCRRLVDEGHSVLALLRSPKKAKLLPGDNVERLEGDLSIFSDRNLELPQCDAVIHLAASLTVKSQDDYEKHYTDTVDLVECLKRQAWQPRRFVFASTLSAAGPSKPGRPLTENDPARPVDSYGKNKLRAERYLAHAPFPTTSFRPGPVFGPGDTAALALFKMAQKGIGFKVAGINQQLCFIFVADLADAVVKMAEETGSEHKLYFATSEEYFDTERLWKTIGDVLGRKLTIISIPKRTLRNLADILTVLSKIFDFDNRLDRKKYEQMTRPAFLCSSAKLQRELGWQPSTDFETTMRLTAQSYRDEGLL